MMKKTLLLLSVAMLALSSCVSKKQFQAKQTEMDEMKLRYEERVQTLNREIDDLTNEIAGLEDEVDQLEDDLLVCNTSLANQQTKAESLQEEVNYLKNTNTNLLDRMAELSVISQAGAENIKKSLETLSEQSKYIQNLNTSIQRKDSVNLVLVQNLKRSLSDVNDEDVTIEVKKGVVYISLSDKMLFKSGRYEITPRANEVLGKIAKVVKDHQELDILVEGHTDNVPIRTNCLQDNWDLSVMRATSVVRSLQERHGVAPERMTAGGRSEFIPKATNETESGRALNRRTEIIILPKLDQFFQLLEAPTADAGN
jgi:chemotaxis protein MotB